MNLANLQQKLDLQSRIIDRITGDMAKWEIVKRTANPLKKLWWDYVPGTKVTVKWPSGWTPPDHLGNQTESADPNDHYRPWLEANVGKQGWDWDWRLSGVQANELMIKFRKAKAKWATAAALKWN